LPDIFRITRQRGYQLSAIINKQENILHSGGQEENASQLMKEKTQMSQAYQGLNPGEFTFE